MFSEESVSISREDMAYGQTACIIGHGYRREDKEQDTLKDSPQ